MEYDDLEETPPEIVAQHHVEESAGTLRAIADFIERNPEIAKGKPLWEVCADVLGIMDELADLEYEANEGYDDPE